MTSAISVQCSTNWELVSLRVRSNNHRWWTMEVNIWKIIYFWTVDWERWWSSQSFGQLLIERFKIQFICLLPNTVPLKCKLPLLVSFLARHCVDLGAFFKTEKVLSPVAFGKILQSRQPSCFHNCAFLWILCGTIRRVHILLPSTNTVERILHDSRSHATHNHVEACALHVELFC